MAIAERTWNSPAQMFDHELNPVKGWPNPYAVDKVKELKAGEAYCYAGRCLSIDPTTDKFVVGCPYSATIQSMPIWAFPNQGDFDVLSDKGNVSGGHVVGLVGNGGYELETTEFLSTGYTPNRPITVHNTADADVGKIVVTNMNSGTLVVGIVSDSGPLTNEFKKQYVRFWPVFCPVHS